MDRVSFDDVLGTNYAPSYNERCFIQSLVNSMEQELSSLNQVLLPLLAKRDKLTDRILAHKTLLTPARRLHPELVSEIFAHAIHSESAEYSGVVFQEYPIQLPRPRVTDAPLKLGRICRHWRQIALSTSSLWSAVEIPTNWGAEGLQEWISRAGSCSLSFRVYIGEQNGEVLNLLASYQKRWKDVILHFDTSPAERQFVRDFLESLSCSYDNLQMLDIYCTPPGWKEESHTDIELTLGVGSAPNLHSLFLNAPKIKTATLKPLPFPCLKEVRFETDPIPAADLLTLLQLSPAVEVVYVYVLYSPDSSDSRHEILTLSNLKHLEISEEWDLEGHPLCPLEKLDLPALERLSFRVAGRWDLAPPFSPGAKAPQIRSLIYKSKPPLVSLRIHEFRMPAADIMYCIPFLPNLSSFDIEYVGAGDDWDGIIQLLTGPIPPSDDTLSGCMCPLLKEIILGPDNDVNPDLVAQMILSRSQLGIGKFSRVAVLSCSESDVLAHPEILECIANGLKFEGGRRWSRSWEGGVHPVQFEAY
ncbi:hypothetical protein BD410DRAFT_358067 [Rickenella mellea]|uniref:F-box domain-containing protein n=1 Tax=Rickenella mellea TaxID=50990 RepID=A0A4Y7PZI6_9AGAM|nr:hypothetical protein BD410DRAFT_358067 [Rickenella mellea]